MTNHLSYTKAQRERIAQAIAVARRASYQTMSREEVRADLAASVRQEENGTYALYSLTDSREVIYLADEEAVDHWLAFNQR